MISAGSAAVLGCGVKRRVGHQLRGRDCENIEGEAGLERRGYCRSQPNIGIFNQKRKRKLLTFGYPSLPFLEFVHKLTNTLGLLSQPKVEDLFCKQYFFPHFGKGGVRKSVHISTFFRTLP